MIDTTTTLGETIVKISDILSHVQKGSSGSDGSKEARLIQPVQPVGHVGKLTLVPGQLVQGEVVGQDANGLFLLKLAGEIIAARTPLKLELGQQFWFEVKEAGDSPLLKLAGQKGAILDLLKDIMATRSLLVKTPTGVSSATPAVPQAEKAGGAASPQPVAAPLSQTGADISGKVPLAASSDQPLPGTAVVAQDGSLPPEAARLIRALVAYMAKPETAGADPGKAEAMKQPPLLKTIVSLIREGQISASLQKEAAFQDVIRPKQPFAAPSLAASTPGPKASGPGNPSVPPGAPSASSHLSPLYAAGSPSASLTTVTPASTPLPPPTVLPESLGPTATGSLSEITFSAPVAVFGPETMKILNALVAVAGIKTPAGGDFGALQPALNPDQNLEEILTLIARQDKIPTSLQRLAPFQMLMGISTSGSGTLYSGLIHGEGAQNNEVRGEGAASAGAVLPLQFAAAQQGSEAMPAQLRLLASLMGLGSREAALEGRQDVEDLLGRLAKAEAPAAARKLASFFEAHSRVNAETGRQGQADFYIMPTIFTGQVGWGEWLWSRERSSGESDGGNQENLVFFLEMSNLGPLTIQVILKEKKLRGQIVMADKKGSELVTSLLPGLQARLEAFGYDVVDFPCRCQPLNVMQELKDSLHNLSGTGQLSLLDVQV